MKIVEIADPSLIEGNLISPIIDDAIKNLPYALVMVLYFGSNLQERVLEI